MDFIHSTRKDIGDYGEKVATAYLRKYGFSIVDQNVSRKTGEIDIIVQKLDILHFIEVKTSLCEEFLSSSDVRDQYRPSENLHIHKISKVARTAQWYIANIGWEGESQIDAVLVWLRARDGVARVRYIPQIL